VSKVIEGVLQDWGDRLLPEKVHGRKPRNIRGGRGTPQKFTAHDDEAHPHVHLVVKAVGRDGVRLNPRKADLQRWRELFADALHEQGIVANATPRRARGIGSRAPAQRLLHMRVRGPNARAPTSSPRAPLLSPVVARAYRSPQQALAASSEVADQRLAQELERFLAETSPTVERERKPDGPTRER